MSITSQPELQDLSLPHLRCEMIAYLNELKANDPRIMWERERNDGFVSGIDQVFHFFFDDYDFDEAAMGMVFLNQDEVSAIETVKRALDAVLEAVGDAGDDEFVEHPLWPQVRRAAVAAHDQLEATA